MYDMIVKDAMVLIHLAKMNLLEKACVLFKKVIIPEMVYNEVVIKGKEKEYEDSFLVESIIKENKINIMKVKNKDMLKKLNEFNIYGGEAESIALYWQENAKLIASDDNSVIRKRRLLNINLIGTPSIILYLYKRKFIDKEKINNSIHKLREIGWFSNAILDKTLMEADKYG